MKNERVLVTAASGDIGVAAIRSLKDAGFDIIGCDMKSITPVESILSRFYQSPPAAEKDEYLKFIKNTIKNDKIRYFLPISEPEIEAVRSDRMNLQGLGTKLVLNNETILEHFLDKLKTVNYLDKLDIDTPKTMLLQKYDGEFGYPLIVKPRNSCGSKNLWKVENSDDLAYVRTKDDKGSYVVQEYLGSDVADYTTGIFSDGNTVSSITFRRKLGYGGLSAEVVLDEHKTLDEIAQKIAEATALRGSINLQSRRVKDVFIPYEINPRLSSTLLFRKKFGFDDAVWWLNILNGEGYHYTKKYKSGSAIRYFSEYYINLDQIDNEGSDHD